MRSISILLLSLFLLADTAMGQNIKNQKAISQLFVLGRIDKIKSVRLSENRTLNVYLPDAYYKDSLSYPVIYLLDGSANEDFVHIVGLVQFLTMIGSMPQSIVVGIANIDRKRDFTFPTLVKEDLKAVPTSGGSAKFISFLGDELQPYIQKHYRTTSQKTIIGQSLGGLLATEILLKRPGLFTDYIIVSPSLWWNHESLLSEASELIKAHPAADRTSIYISAGTEGEQMQQDVDRLMSILKKEAGSKLQLRYAPFPEESHLTILHRSVYKALDTTTVK